MKLLNIILCSIVTVSTFELLKFRSPVLQLLQSNLCAEMVMLGALLFCQLACLILLVSIPESLGTLLGRNASSESKSEDTFCSNLLLSVALLEVRGNEYPWSFNLRSSASDIFGVLLVFVEKLKERLLSCISAIISLKSFFEAFNGDLMLSYHKDGVLLSLEGCVLFLALASAMECDLQSVDDVPATFSPPGDLKMSPPVPRNTLLDPMLDNVSCVVRVEVMQWSFLLSLFNMCLLGVTCFELVLEVSPKPLTALSTSRDIPLWWLSSSSKLCSDHSDDKFGCYISVNEES